jgi:hypothetical protein
VTTHIKSEGAKNAFCNGDKEILQRRESERFSAVEGMMVTENVEASSLKTHEQSEPT